MTIEEVLREMREVHTNHNIGVRHKWADAIEAAMREKDAEIERLEAKLTECDGKLGKRPCQNGRCMEYVGLVGLAADNAEEIELLRAKIERLKAEIHPDWDKLDVCRESLREHMALVQERDAEIERLREDKERLMDRIDGCHQSMQEKDAEIERLKVEQARYRELLYAVSKVTPEESRHETALRYIREREEAALLRESDQQCAALAGKEPQP